MERVRAMPVRPAEIPEWEDLLVRFEILPRALRVTLEERGAKGTEAAEILRAMLNRESDFAAWLERATPAGRGRDEDDEVLRPAEIDLSTAMGLADRIASGRARNFAMLQRRGIDVWEWSAPLGSETVTAHQMVGAMVMEDARALAALREGRPLGAGAC